MTVRILRDTMTGLGYPDEAALDEAILYARAELECHSYTEGVPRPRFAGLITAIVFGDGTYEILEPPPPPPTPDQPLPSDEEIAAMQTEERRVRRVLKLGDLLVAKGILTAAELHALGDEDPAPASPAQPALAAPTA